jgi:hypothetical protein
MTQFAASVASVGIRHDEYPSSLSAQLPMHPFSQKMM